MEHTGSEASRYTTPATGSNDSRTGRLRHPKQTGGSGLRQIPAIADNSRTSSWRRKIRNSWCRCRGLHTPVTFPLSSNRRRRSGPGPGRQRTALSVSLAARPRSQPGEAAPQDHQRSATARFSVRKSQRRIASGPTPSTTASWQAGARERDLKGEHTLVADMRRNAQSPVVGGQPLQDEDLVQVVQQARPVSPRRGVRNWST